MPLWTRSAASSAAAPPEPTDKTMMSADATGSFTTSTHPAARRTGSRRERTTTIANAANPSTTKIGAHLGHMKITLRFIKLLHDACWRTSAMVDAPTLPASVHKPSPFENLIASPPVPLKPDNTGMPGNRLVNIGRERNMDGRITVTPFDPQPDPANLIT